MLPKFTVYQTSNWLLDSKTPILGGLSYEAAKRLVSHLNANREDLAECFVFMSA